MNEYSKEILKVLLETKKELRNSEIRDRLWDRVYSKRGIEKSSFNVINTRHLKKLESDFLRRRVVGHRDVRYSFRSEKTREKAKMILVPEKLKALITEIISTTDDKLKADIILRLFYSISSIGMFSFLNKEVFDAIKQRDVNELQFYKERLFELLNAGYEAVFDTLKEMNPKNLNQLNSVDILFDTAGLSENEKEETIKFKGIVDSLWSFEGLIQFIKLFSEDVWTWRSEKLKDEKKSPI